MKLIIIEPAGEKRELELGSETYSLGRNKDNDIAINDSQVSGKHARLTPKKDTFVIEDLKSMNGVYVNDIKIQQKQRLEGGDLIKIGNTTIEVESAVQLGMTQPEMNKAEEAQFMTMPMAAPHMIVLNKAKKVYKLGKTEVNALKGVDLKVAEGEFISICGPSGSGKSTLLNLIGCIDKATSGSISVMGKDVSKYSDSALSRMRNKIIGFIFQSFNLIPVLNAFENVEYPLVIQGIPKSKRYEKVVVMLKEVGLSDFVKHKPDELSGGQRQRVAIARALVTSPKMVLADEPTANLDSVTSVEILELMKKMNEDHKTTFIFSTHDPRIMKYAKKIYNMVDGVLEN